jgi:biotin carboxyl carrier protein
MGQMKWRVRLGDSEHRVEIPVTGEGGRWVGEVRIDDKPVAVDVAEADQGGLSLIVEGRSYSVDFDRRGEKLALVLGRTEQRLMPYTVTDERQMASAAAASRRSHEGQLKILAPMPGKVVRVLVKPGEQVKVDQGLLVVEAMKMENELRAPRAGRISEVLVREGAAVEGGATLCVLE